MSVFNSSSIPEITDNKQSDFLIINHISSDGNLYTMKTSISSIPICLANDETYGGLKTGYEETTEDDGLYALKMDENGDGYFTVNWTDKYILSAEYNPSLSAIQILVNDNGEPKIINVDVKDLIDNYHGDGKTIDVTNNVFSVKDGVFLKGNYVLTDNFERYCLSLYRGRNGYYFGHVILYRGQNDTDYSKNRLYYIQQEDMMRFYTGVNQFFDLYTPTASAIISED